MFDQFYLKSAIEKDAVHDADFELYAIQKARELNWDEFKAKANRLLIVLKDKTEYHQEGLIKLLLELNQTKNPAV